jgi:hypothetical protein
MFAAFEAEFNSIINDVRSVPEKLEALVGLHTRAQAVEALAAPMTAVIEDASKTTEVKVTEILTMVGKL